MLASKRALETQPETDRGAATFLLVDDDFVSILIMRRVLKKLGIANRTLVARDGREALETLKARMSRNQAAQPVFIVILDMNMPRMSGGDFLRAVDMDPSIKDLVIFAFETACQSGQTSSSAFANVAAFLNKDAPLETLSRAIISTGCGPLLEYNTQQ